MSGTVSDRPMLFEPIELRGVTSRNRIMLSPMCQYSARDGLPNEWHYIHLATRAVGGAGIVMTEATAVESIGRISPWDVGIYNDEQEAVFARIAGRVAEYGAVPAMQLAHAGRKASHTRPSDQRLPLTESEGGWEVIGPSGIAWEPGDLVPKAMTVEDIADVVAKWGLAAERARRAGFQLIEIHAAHGYLIHEFLSPISNQRSDAYGGAVESRARFLLEIVDAVRRVWPDDLPLSVRMSASDWIDGGWTLDDTVVVAKLLKERGVDIVDCSGGGTSPEQVIDSHPGYQVPFAETVRREAGIMTAAVGLLIDPFELEEILQTGRADIVVLGRMLLWDPYWPHHAAAAMGVPLDLPIQYERSGIHSRLHAGGTTAHPRR